MRYRLGRSHQDIVYRQLGDEPSDEDPRVAVFGEAIEAIRVVQLLNDDEPLLVRCRSNPTPHVVDDNCRDIYEAPAVEPVSVPPPAERACCVDAEQGPDAYGTLLHTLGCANRCGVETTWYPPSAPLHGSTYPCGATAGHEGDHWAPPPLRTPLVADEPAPVPPPVDALLNLVDELYQADEAAAIDVARGNIVMAARDLWRAGVAEGRRQAAGPVLAEVVAERLRQDARWGEQNHPDGTNLDNAAWRDYSRRLTQRAADEGRVTWAHILQEEFVEALAEVEPARIRAELIQTAAVAVAWVQAIDRRQP